MDLASCRIAQLQLFTVSFFTSRNDYPAVKASMKAILRGDVWLMRLLAGFGMFVLNLGLFSFAADGVRQVELPLRGLAYDSASQKLYGTSAETNRLLQINPSTGQVTASFDVGDKPSRVALSAGHGLWIGLDGAGSVRRFDLDTLTTEEPVVILDGADVIDIAPSPADPYTLAVTVAPTGGNRVSYMLRNGQLLPNTSPVRNVALFGGFVYGVVGGTIYKLDIGSDGFIPRVAAAGIGDGDVIVSGGFIYNSFGFFQRTSDFQFQGKVFAPGQVSINEETDELLFLNPSGPFNRYDRLSRRHTGNADLGMIGDASAPLDLVAWGTNRAAFHNSTDLFLLETDKLFPPADISVSQLITNPVVEFGSELTIAVTVTNKGPGVALDVVLTNQIETFDGIERRYILQAVDGASPGEWSHISPISRTIGDLAAGAVQRFSIQLLPKTPGPLTNRVAIAANNDLSLENNTNVFVAEVNRPTNGLARLQLPLVDAIFDRPDNRIVAADGVNLWWVNPDELRIAEPIYFAATRLAAGPNGVVYAGLHNAGNDYSLYIGQFPGNPLFIAEHVPITDLEGSPTDPALLAVSTTSGTSLYRDGLLLPNSVSDKGYLEFSSDGTELYLVNAETCDLKSYAITETGITLKNTFSTLSCSDFRSGGGLLFFDSGLVFDPVLGQKAPGVPTFTLPAFIIPNSVGAFDVLHRTNNLWGIRRFRRSASGEFEQFASRDIGSIANPVVEVFSAGDDRLAYRTSSELVWIDLPADPSSLKASISLRTANEIRIRFPSVSGAEYRIESRAELGQGQWTPVGNDLTGDGGFISVTLPAGNAPHGYYRVARLL
jgi:hypothetical protein